MCLFIVSGKQPCRIIKASCFERIVTRNKSNVYLFYSHLLSVNVNLAAVRLTLKNTKERSKTIHEGRLEASWDEKKTT